MSKLKKDLEPRERLFYNYKNNGKLSARFLDSDAHNVNDVDYYKNQDNNPLFMSMKEDLIKSIKRKLNSLKHKLSATESEYKKELVQMEIDKFNVFDFNFPNTWEKYEFTEKVFNHGKVLDEDGVNEVINLQKKIREDAREEVLSQIMYEDRFIKNYISFLFSHPIIQLFIFPLIIFIFMYLRMIITAPWYYTVVDYICIFFEYLGGVYGPITIAVMFSWVLISYMNEKFLNKLMLPKKKTPELDRKFKHNIITIIGTLGLFELIKRMFHKPNNK